jgi:hypothetical protein
MKYDIIRLLNWLINVIGNTDVNQKGGMMCHRLFGYEQIYTGFGADVHASGSQHFIVEKTDMIERRDWLKITLIRLFTVVGKLLKLINVNLPSDYFEYEVLVDIQERLRDIPNNIAEIYSGGMCYNIRRTSNLDNLIKRVRVRSVYEKLSFDNYVFEEEEMERLFMNYENTGVGYYIIYKKYQGTLNKLLDTYKNMEYHEQEPIILQLILGVY